MIVVEDHDDRRQASPPASCNGLPMGRVADPLLGASLGHEVETRLTGQGSRIRYFEGQVRDIAILRARQREQGQIAIDVPTLPPKCPT